MATLLSRSLFKHNLRPLYKSVSTLSQTTFNEERKSFEAVFPEVVNSVINGPNLKDLPEMKSRVNKMLNYMVTGGKLYRGMGVSIGYRMLEDPVNYTEENQHLARILGWCEEMFQAIMLIADDVIDGGVKRRGKPCWNRLPEIGLSAVNDCILLNQTLMEVLEINFGKEPSYVDLLRIFNQALYKVTIGEHLDCAWDYKRGRTNIDSITLENVRHIHIHKIYYTFRLPTLLIMHLLKNGKEMDSKALNDICLDLGVYLQCSDDYIDAYGKELITGKVGRDIQEGKCNWVAAAALKHCNAAQRATFEEFYGSENPDHVKRIKQLYDELNMPQLYEQFRRNLHDDLVHRIQGLPNDRQKNFYLGVLNICSDM